MESTIPGKWEEDFGNIVLDDVDPMKSERIRNEANAKQQSVFLHSAARQSATTVVEFFALYQTLTTEKAIHQVAKQNNLTSYVCYNGALPLT